MKIDELKRFAEWKEKWENPSEMNWQDYISFNFHPEDVLITSRLFFPELIEVEDCVFLKEKYSEENYLVWKNKFEENSIDIEKMINHVHLYDIFSHCEDDIEDDVYLEVGKVLRASWEIYFKKIYPEKNFVIDLMFSDKDYGPILYLYQKKKVGRFI